MLQGLRVRSNMGMQKPTGASGKRRWNSVHRLPPPEMIQMRLKKARSSYMLLCRYITLDAIQQFFFLGKSSVRPPCHIRVSMHHVPCVQM